MVCMNAQKCIILPRALRARAATWTPGLKMGHFWTPDFSNPRLSPAPHCFLLNVKINHKTLKLIVFIYNMNMIDRMRKSPLR